MKQIQISRSNVAFTLIELLVVVAIIAILAAIIFPVFAQAKISAKHTACLSNMRQVAMAFNMYAGNNDDGYPPLFGVPDSIILPGTNYKKPLLGYDVSVSPHSSPRRPVTPGHLDDFVKDRRIYKCPFQPDKYQIIWGFNAWILNRSSNYYSINPLARNKEFGPLGSATRVVAGVSGSVYDPVNASRDEEPHNQVFYWHHSADTVECSTLQASDFYYSMLPNTQDHLVYFTEGPFRNKIHRGNKMVILVRTGGNITTKHASQIRRPEFSMQKSGMGYPDY